jgi:hypothetical protein
MKQALSMLTTELDFMTDVILIENNDELERAYGARVPVLMFEEEMICEYFLDRVTLEKAMAKNVDKKHS